MKHLKVTMLTAALTALTFVSPGRSRAQVELGDPTGIQFELQRNTQYFNMQTKELSQRVEAEKKERQEAAKSEIEKEIDEQVGKKPYFLRMEHSGGLDVAVHRVSLYELGEAKLYYGVLERWHAQLAMDLRAFKKDGSVSKTLIKEAESTLGKIEGKQAAIRKLLASEGTHAGDLQEGRDYTITKSTIRIPR